MKVLVLRVLEIQGSKGLRGRFSFCCEHFGLCCELFVIAVNGLCYEEFAVAVTVVGHRIFYINSEYIKRINKFWSEIY